MISLGDIKVLFRAPDSLALYGIPYEMRPGQSPSDLWRGRRIEDTTARARGYLGATISVPGPREDWVWLGTPGWYGNLDADAQRVVREYLLPLQAMGVVPGGPFEWSRLADWGAAT